MMFQPSRRALLGALSLPFLPLPVLAAGGVVPKPVPVPVSAGSLWRYDLFPSALTAPRRVDVWLPPGYEGGTQSFSVLYMHDGQNLFDPASTPFGEWGVDEAMARLLGEGAVKPAIVVGVWNTKYRSREYLPQAPYETVPADIRADYEKGSGGPALSDGYVDFLVKELKPFIDATYRTRSGPADTAIMGSSMGGLISLYALIRYPAVFGAAGCVSTHWPSVTNFDWIRTGDARMVTIADTFIAWVKANLLRAGGNRIYFDLGNAELDSFYPPFQAKVDAFMPGLGYVQGKDWVTTLYEGEPHNEVAWRKRVEVPLRFLLGV
ncbi:MAG: alpha/beta hydrolase [Niveispirillum sp.]|uniref:alpha/beta hydrolase n=1 Tax=Niveispirillum sp. TaxID=1917217 RepID=UPI004036A90D